MNHNIQALVILTILPQAAIRLTACARISGEIHISLDNPGQGSPGSSYGFVIEYILHPYQEKIMRKKPKISRREFLRFLLAYGFSATAAGALSSLTGCDAEESSNPTAQPTATSKSAAEAVPISMPCAAAPRWGWVLSISTACALKMSLFRPLSVSPCTLVDNQ